jgi:mRNA deadenylase 3'-5' endonuclease subunit Ccr4
MIKSGYESTYVLMKNIENPWTTWKKTLNEGNYVTKKAVEDYIFCKGTTMVCKQVLELPKDVSEILYPNEDYPSDHMVIAARFEF